MSNCSALNTQTDIRLTKSHSCHILKIYLNFLLAVQLRPGNIPAYIHDYHIPHFYLYHVYVYQRSHHWQSTISLLAFEASGVIHACTLEYNWASMAAVVLIKTVITNYDSYKSTVPLASAGVGDLYPEHSYVFRPREYISIYTLEAPRYN